MNQDQGPRPEPSLPELPRYDLQEALGEGASACVYRAWDRELQRPVALKILRATIGLNHLARQRFRREAQASASLAHPNVITLYDACEHEGVFYLVMELVEGVSFDTTLQQKHLGLPALVALLEKAARGVGAAHQRGIVHRDLKPANILVTLAGEPKVGDFGLAHVADAATELTRVGVALGTPSYMSPEQVEARRGDLSPRTDVYALGAILYQILTGRPPHLAPSIPELYAMILEEDPAPPHGLKAGLPPDLELVALKALDKDPAGRYRDGTEFADDLKRYLAGEPVQARSLSSADQVWRAFRKRRAVLLPAAAALLLAAGLGFWALQASAAKEKAFRADLALAAAREREGRLEDARLLYQAALQREASSSEAREGFQRADRAAKNHEAERKKRDDDEREAMKLLETARPAIDRAARYLYDKDANYAELVRRVDERIDLIEQSVHKAPRRALGHYLLGRAWEIKGWDDRAEASYRKAIDAEPDFGP